MTECRYDAILNFLGQRIMNATDIARLQQYLQTKFANPNFEVRGRPNKDDSAEVYLSDEFIGVLFIDEDDDDTYHFNMAILDIDLPENSLS